MLLHVRLVYYYVYYGIASLLQGIILSCQPCASPFLSVSFPSWKPSWPQSVVVQLERSKTPSALQSGPSLTQLATHLRQPPPAKVLLGRRAERSVGCCGWRGRFPFAHLPVWCAGCPEPPV